MKYLSRALAAAVALTLLGMGPALRAQNVRTIHVEVNISQDDVVLEKEFIPPQQTLITRVRLEVREPAGFPDVLGFPQLPYLTRVVAVPAGSTLGNVSVTPGQQVLVQDVGLIAWAQPPRPSQNPNQGPTFPTGTDGSAQFAYYAAPDSVPPDPSVYQFQVWPPQMVELASSRTEAGYQLFTYRLYPVQWYPSQGFLTIATSISLDMSYVPGPAPAPGSYAEAMEIDHLRSTATNAGHVISPMPRVYPPGPDTRYLIITDNFQWNPDMTRGASVGNMVDEFRRLAEWKTQKGLRASVVTVSNIMNGKYGDFVGGARDLQEVIRNFLKHANRDWSTFWVLIGGDIEVVPVRHVAANIYIHDHYLKRNDSQTLPEPFFCSFDSATKSLRLQNVKNGDGIGDSSVGPYTLIVSERTGRAFARLARIPSESDPGWIYTDSTYSGDTRFYSDNIILRGSKADIAGSDFYTVQLNNSVPTDLYYASLEGDQYDVPGLHDWDKNDNGLYGQYNSEPMTGDPMIDGVNFYANTALGRAPVSSKAEAKVFVDKVLSYERYQGMFPNFGKRLILGSDNWYGGPAAGRIDKDPPPAEKYFQKDGDTIAKLHFAGPPGGETFRLYAQNSTENYWEIPYDLGASESSLGYYFCTGGDYATPSVSGSIRVPTQYVKVIGRPHQVNPSWYYFNPSGADPSLTEKEAVRAILSSGAPGLSYRKRLYRDIQDAPGYLTDSDLSVLSDENMKSALNVGFNVLSLSGHGYWRGCCGVNVSWVPSLTNGLEGGVVYADSCLTSEFDEPKYEGMFDAVSESFLTNPDGGAAAYIGNSRFSIIGLGSYFEQTFWKAITAKRRLGDALRSRWVLDTNSQERWVNYTINLLGDPEMVVWLDEPGKLEVLHPPSVFQGDALLVKVNTSTGEPLPSALVAITGPREILEVAETDSSGEASFSTADKKSGDVLTITVTADGFVPYQGTAAVKIRFTRFDRADANLDGVIDISDALTVFGALFLGTNQLPCPQAADANGDNAIDISDGVVILQFLFLGGQVKGGPPSCQ